jgi:hypothetical protein
MAGCVGWAPGIRGYTFTVGWPVPLHKQDLLVFGIVTVNETQAQ